MINETKNELLSILHYVKGAEEYKQFHLDYLLESFRNDIKRKLEDLESEKRQLLENLELLDDVKKEIKGESAKNEKI